MIIGYPSFGSAVNVGPSPLPSPVRTMRGNRNSFGYSNIYAGRPASRTHSVNDRFDDDTASHTETDGGTDVGLEEAEAMMLGLHVCTPLQTPTTTPTTPAPHRRERKSSAELEHRQRAQPSCVTTVADDADCSSVAPSISAPATFAPMIPIRFASTGNRLHPPSQSSPSSNFPLSGLASAMKSPGDRIKRTAARVTLSPTTLFANPIRTFGSSSTSSSPHAEPPLPSPGTFPKTPDYRPQGASAFNNNTEPSPPLFGPPSFGAPALLRMQLMAAQSSSLASPSSLSPCTLSPTCATDTDFPDSSPRRVQSCGIAIPMHLSSSPSSPSPLACSAPYGSFGTSPSKRVARFKSLKPGKLSLPPMQSSDIRFEGDSFMLKDFVITKDGAAGKDVYLLVNTPPKPNIGLSLAHAAMTATRALKFGPSGNTTVAPLRRCDSCPGAVSFRGPSPADTAQSKLPSGDAEEKESVRPVSPTIYSNDEESSRLFPTFGGRIQFEDLEIMEELGKGYSSHVARVHHIHTMKDFALKVIPLETFATAESSGRDLSSARAFRERTIERELQVLYFNHKCDHMLKYYDAYYRDGCLQLLLEYMHYGSLTDVGKLFPPVLLTDDRGPIPERVLQSIAQQALTALVYMHETMKQVHRDIKTGNLLVNESGQVKLADFGISSSFCDAREAGSKHSSGGGTMLFMSPERHQVKPHSWPCDIWALGLTLADAALGRYPFDIAEMSGPFDLLSIITSPIKWPTAPRLSESFKHFVVRCMANDPDCRPSARELLNDPWLQETGIADPTGLAELLVAQKNIVELKLSASTPVLLSAPDIFY